MKISSINSVIKRKSAFVICTVALLGYAETKKYEWDSSSNRYGEDVTVMYSEDQSVSRIDATVSKENSIIFTGGEISFAPNATICLNGLGSLIFSNDIQSTALNLSSDFTNHTVTFDNLSAGTSASVSLGDLGIKESDQISLDDIEISKGQLIYTGNSIIDLKPYLIKKENNAYSIQLQNYNGAWTRCAKITLAVNNGALSAFCEYIRQYNVYTENVLGKDFDDTSDGNTINFSGSSLASLTINIIHKDTNRNIIFAGNTKLNNLNISGGINFAITGDCIGANNCATLSQSINFNQGSFELVNAGIFTNKMTVTGSNGRMLFSSTDVAAPETTIVTPLVVPTEIEKVVLTQTALSSIRAITGNVSFVVYNSNDLTQKANLHDEFKKPFGAMMVRNIGNEMVARFHATVYNMSYGGALLFRQVGPDITVKVCSTYDFWWTYDQNAKNPWTWDYFNRVIGTNPTNCRANNRMTVDNITFALKGCLGTPASPTHMYYDLQSTNVDPKNIRHIFKPGANRKMTAFVTGAVRGANLIEACEGTTLEFKNTNHNTGYLGLWHKDIANPPLIVVHSGAKVINDRNWQNSVYQTIDLRGGKFAHRDPDNDKVSYSDYAFFKGRASKNHVHAVRYSDGAQTHGWGLLLGNEEVPDSELVVTGTTPSSAENGFYVGGTKLGAAENPGTLTLNIEDVTSDESVDFTLYLPIKQQEGATWVQIRKIGAGTVLLNAKDNIITNAPIILTEGILEIATNDCLNANTDFVFDGGTLKAMASCEYKFDEVTVTSSGEIVLPSNSTIRFNDSSANDWASNGTLDFICDASTTSIFFEGLNVKQQANIRLNGEKCHLNKEGKLVPGERGMAIIIR